MRVLILLLCCMPLFAARTTVTDTIRSGSGALANGTIYVTPNQTFTTSDGIPVYAIPTAAVVRNGVFTIQLYPNDATSSPASGTSYSARFALSGSTTQVTSETWSVPTSGSPVSLANVRTSPAPSPSVSGYITSLNGLNAVTQLFARVNDTNVTLSIGSAVSTHTFTMGWTGLLAVARGGSGAATLTGLLKGNGTSPFTAATAGTDFIGGVGNLTTAGAVPYVSSTGTLNQDGSNFFWNATNHQLCIGCTTFPDVFTKLNVNGPSSVVLRAAGAAGNNEAELALVSGGGGGGGDHAIVSFAKAGTVEFLNTGVWNGNPGWAVRDVPAGFLPRIFVSIGTGNVSIGAETDSGYKFDVLGSTRTSAFRLTQTASDPGCTLSSDLGNQWTDSTSATTTHFKVCANVASSPVWVQVF